MTRALVVTLFLATTTLACAGRSIDPVDGGDPVDQTPPSVDRRITPPDDREVPPDVSVDRPRPDLGRDEGPDIIVPPLRVPLVHRATADACDDVRNPGNPPDPTFTGPVDCKTDADCTAGQNGRCNGNGHDGWRCTYDECFSDADCGGGICQCSGGFRADNNVCLVQNGCRTDADCGADGFCSPTFGDCGAYSGIVAYYCHTPQDECVDDTDCGDGSPWGAYCAYNLAAGRWTCSTQQCAG